MSKKSVHNGISRHLNNSTGTFQLQALTHHSMHQYAPCIPTTMSCFFKVDSCTVCRVVLLNTFYHENTYLTLLLWKRTSYGKYRSTNLPICLKEMNNQSMKTQHAYCICIKMTIKSLDYIVNKMDIFLRGYTYHKPCIVHVLTPSGMLHISFLFQPYTNVLLT